MKSFGRWRRPFPPAKRRPHAPTTPSDAAKAWLGEFVALPKAAQVIGMEMNAFVAQALPIQRAFLRRWRWRFGMTERYFGQRLARWPGAGRLGVAGLPADLVLLSPPL